MPAGNPNRRERWTAELALLGVCSIWGCNFAVMKSALGELHPFAFNAIRITMSALILGAMHHRGRRRHPRRPLPPGTWPKIFGVSLVGCFGYQVFFLTGLARTTTANSALILGSSPIVTAALGLMVGERLRRLAYCGLVRACAGTAIIAFEKGADIDNTRFLGNLLTLGAACAWGSYAVLNRNLVNLAPASTVAFYTTLATLPLHWLIAAPHLAPLWSLDISGSAWSAIAYSGLLGTGLAYALWNIGLRHLGPTHTAGTITLVPLIALLVAWLWLGEPITLLQTAGATAVLGGVWLVRYRP